MDRIMAVDGAPLAPESLRMLDYLRTRASEMSAMAIRSRIHAAAGELENAIAAVSASEARLRPFAGKWTIAEVVDHISQTQVRGAEELRHLLAGRRPPPTRLRSPPLGRRAVGPLGTPCRRTASGEPRDDGGPGSRL